MQTAIVEFSNYLILGSRKFRLSCKQFVSDDCKVGIEPLKLQNLVWVQWRLAGKYWYYRPGAEIKWREKEEFISK